MDKFLVFIKLINVVLKSADNKTAPLEITILPDPSP
jgi:hypothetical protein